MGAEQGKIQKVKSSQIKKMDAQLATILDQLKIEVPF